MLESRMQETLWDFQPGLGSPPLRRREERKMSVGLDRSLRTSHRVVLAMIALLAVLSAIQPGDDDGAVDDD